MRPGSNSRLEDGHGSSSRLLGALVATFEALDNGAEDVGIEEGGDAARFTWTAGRLGKLTVAINSGHLKELGWPWTHASRL